MAEAYVTDTKLTLKYADKGTFTFSDFKPATNDENLYEVAKLLNAFQKDAFTQVVKVTTKTIME